MSYLTGHWVLGPLVAIAAAVVAWHEAGLARLARRARPDRTRQRRRRSWLFYAGLAVGVLAVASPLDYWAGRYFFVHMIQHLLLMFAAPSLLVAGAPWQPLLDGLPGRSGRALARETLRGGWARPLRAAAGFLLRPWAAVALFSAVMIAWHLPVLYDLSVTSEPVHLWLMHGTFLAAGILFWLQFIPSPPVRRRMPPVSQAAALLLTNAVMWVLAMSMSVLTQAPWYPVLHHVPGVTLPALADQQLGAAILWVCGDFWAVPALIVVVRRIIEADGGAGMAVDKILRRGAGSLRWAGGGGLLRPPGHPLPPSAGNWGRSPGG